MRLLCPIAGLMVVNLLACSGEGSSTTGGLPGGTGSTGEATSTGEIVSSSSSTVSPTTSEAPTTSGGPSTGEDGTTVVTSNTTEGPGSSSGGPKGSQCEGSTLALCESFEGAAEGGFPAGWGARGDEWGEGVIGVASDEARLGAKALKVDGGNNGQHFMDYKGELGALATRHFGRVFMKVAVPAPWPVDGVLHADFIEGLGPGPGGSTHNVRWGVVENTAMGMQWIYNVQPSNGDPEFGEGTGYDYAWSGAWECIEWFYDQPSQQGMLWIDGIELPIVPGTNHNAEIPVFGSLGVGLANYQAAGSGFTVWFDELAYDGARIGCDL